MDHDSKVEGYRYQRLQASQDETNVPGTSSQLSRRTSEDTCQTQLLAKDDEKGHSKGLTTITGAFFVTGEIVGGGVVALPAAMVHCGWGGIPTFVIIAFMCTYCCVLLARCLHTIRQEEGENYESRSPYPKIGHFAFGKVGSIAVYITLYTNLIVVPIVYMLLAAKSISWTVALDATFLPEEERFRVWLTLSLLLLIPLSWFGTPKNFWGVAVIASLTVAAASLLITVCLFIIAPESVPSVKQPTKDLLGVSSALGTFVFGFTGASLLPTIQSDLREPTKFSKVVYFGYAGAFLMYTFPTISALVILGEKTKANVIDSIIEWNNISSVAVLVYIIQLLMSAHFLSAFVIFLNPTSQNLEKFFNVPNEFSWKRCLIRTLLVLAIFTCAQVLPKFSPLLDLAGGSVNVFLCFIFPSLFYLKLHWADTSLPYTIFIIGVVVVSTVILLFATYANILNVARTLGKLYH